MQHQLLIYVPFWSVPVSPIPPSVPLFPFSRPSFPINYRFGPVVFHTNGGARFDMGSDGKAEFECGGVMEFAGHPYRVCTTNVN